jgi:hypothetical protein
MVIVSLDLLEQQDRESERIGDESTDELVSLGMPLASCYFSSYSLADSLVHGVAFNNIFVFSLTVTLFSGYFCYYLGRLWRIRNGKSDVIGHSTGFEHDNMVAFF